MKSNKLKREPKYIAKFKAFPYQQEAVDAVKDLEYAAIFHEQGLGKTKIAIDVLLYWLSECSMDTALIVTKKQLVANWVNEFKDHTSIKPAVLNTDKNNNYRIFCGPYRVVLTNFETLETEKQQFELYLKVRNVGIIIDESAKLKNPNSKLTKTYFELAPLFQRRIIMTGTPVANRPYDIWAQIYFLDFGESLGADFNEFKKETDLSNKLSRNTDLQEEFEDNISQIFNRISSFTVRETKNSGIITLPDKVYIQEVTEFNRMQEELYERIRTELYAEVVRDGERYIDDSSAIVKRLLRLIQVTSNPKLVDEECEASAKEPLLEGNSRLAAYRILAKNDPLKWSRVLVQILPEDISDSDIFTLLGTFHLNPKKDWSKFEQAAYIYRQKKELGCSDSALGKQVGISAITVKKYCEIYGLMVEHNDTHQSHWNMYEQYVQNKGIKQYRNTYPEMDSFFAKQVKTGGIVRAQDVRDILGKIASDEGKSSTHIMQDYIKGDIDLEEAHARFEATGRSGDNYEKVKKFQRLISEKDFCDELKKEAVGNSKDILFSLRKINTAVTQLMKEIDKKK